MDIAIGMKALACVAGETFIRTLRVNKRSYHQVEYLAIQSETPLSIAHQLHLRFAGFFAALPCRSLARRFSVLFFAAANEAFLARAERSSGVEPRAALLPPCLPNSRAI